MQRHIVQLDTDTVLQLQTLNNSWSFFYSPLTGGQYEAKRWRY